MKIDFSPREYMFFKYLYISIQNYNIIFES